MFEYFYHEILRKTVIGFGTLFNGIKIQRKDNSNNIFSIVEVPIAYGPTQKFLARLEQSPELNKPVQITLPRLSFELTGLNYDSARKVAPTQSFLSPTKVDGKDVRKTYMPVPYNVEFELSVMTKSNDDMLQIIEQILPYFQPSYNISIDLLELIGEKRDIPITLDSIIMSDDYEGDFSTRRALIYTLKFTAKTYLFGPISSPTDTDIIKKVSIGYITGEKGRTASRELTYRVEPKATKNYVDDVFTTLLEDIVIASDRFSVEDSSVIPEKSHITIDNETMYVVSKVENDIKVKRGEYGTPITKHVSGSKINLITAQDNLLVEPGDDFGFSETFI